MIITDPSKRPSERFIETVYEYFISQDYKFKKSEKSFIRPTDKGFEKVWLQFFTTVDLVSVSIFWSKSYIELEKIFAELKGHPKKYKTEVSICTDLSNHTRWFPNVEHTWNLFDNRTLKCDDIVLNKASKGFINGYETYVTRFFKNYDTYENLEKILNISPMKHPPFSMFYDRHVAFGLLLAKFFNRQDLDMIISEYKSLANSMIKDIRLEMIQMLDKTLNFIEHNDIKNLIK